MADTLVDDFDVVDLLTGLADRCVNVLDVSAAGVMLAAANGELRVVASSSETMRVLELFELQAQEGPCLDAFRTGEHVDHWRLDDEVNRWPAFSPAAYGAGFRSVLAIPLRLRSSTIGALNLFSVESTPIGDADLVVARAFADLATISVVQHRFAADAQRVNEQLSEALTSRIVIEQAKGMIAERARIDLEKAFSRLRRHARNHNLRLTELAHAVVGGTLDQQGWDDLLREPAP